jgi:hypothetical protein
VSGGRKTASQGTKSTRKTAVFGDLSLKNTLPNPTICLPPANQSPAQSFLSKFALTVLFIRCAKPVGDATASLQRGRATTLRYFALYSPKLFDVTAHLHRVLMNFQFREKWTVHFLEADCKTPLWRGRYYDFESVDRVREIRVRASSPPAVFEELERCVRAWSRGSVYLDLTEEQYARLKRGV